VLTVSGGRCSYAAVGLTNVADTPLYAAEASAALKDSSLDDAAVSAAVKAAEAIMQPAADGRGSAEFRTKVGGAMLRRAIAMARGRVA
jgi:carbon-monoxide dehydrogenase medium subunit